MLKNTILFFLLISYALTVSYSLSFYFNDTTCSKDTSIVTLSEVTNPDGCFATPGTFGNSTKYEKTSCTTSHVNILSDCSDALCTNGCKNVTHSTICSKLGSFNSQYKCGKLVYPNPLPIGSVSAISYSNRNNCTGRILNVGMLFPTCVGGSIFNTARVCKDSNLTTSFYPNSDKTCGGNATSSKTVNIGTCDLSLGVKLGDKCNTLPTSNSTKLTFSILSIILLLFLC